MPVILEEEDDRQLWLQGGYGPGGHLSHKVLALLRPYEGSQIVVHRVSPLVNNVRNVQFPFLSLPELTNELFEHESAPLEPMVAYDARLMANHPYISLSLSLSLSLPRLLATPTPPNIVSSLSLSLFLHHAHSTPTYAFCLLNFLW